MLTRTSCYSHIYNINPFEHNFNATLLRGLELGSFASHITSVPNLKPLSENNNNNKNNNNEKTNNKNKQTTTKNKTTNKQQQQKQQQQKQNTYHLILYFMQF